jgi:hypothetical protein
LVGLELFSESTAGLALPDTLRCVREMQQLASRRPAEFTKLMKLLEAILDRSLGITRRKPAVLKKRRSPCTF